MKRILHIVGKMDRAGAETMLMNLYRHIDRSKIQFDFITFTEEKGDYDEEIISLGGKIFPIVAPENRSRMSKLKDFLKKNPEYQIVQSHMLLNSMFSLQAAKDAGVKHRICHSHSTSNGERSFLKNIYEKIAKRRIKKLSTFKIACGMEAGAYLFPGQNDFIVFPNGVDVEELASLKGEVKNNLLSSLEGMVKVLQVGRLSRVKNPFFTLEIAKEVKKQDLPIHIYFAGQGDLEQEIKDVILENDLQDYVTLLGVRDDVPELMAEADVLILPSFHEGFPVVLVESQAVGLPALVSTAVSAEVDIGTGLISFLAIEEVQPWIEALKKLNFPKPDDQKRLDVLSEKGFNVRHNAGKLEEIYTKMI